MTPEQESARGTRAEQLLKSDIYRESVGKVRQGIIEQWSASPLRDREGHYALRVMLKLLDDLEQNIVSVANGGKVARAQIEADSKLKEMAKKAAQGLTSLIR